MASLAFYGDESGTTEGKRVATVAGYLAQIGEWRGFERDWSKVLKRYHIELMHRSDLESFYGAFVGWNGIRRTALLSELQPIIKSHTKVAIGAAVIKQDWEEVMPNWVKRFLAVPMGGVRTIALWLSENGANVRPQREGLHARSLGHLSKVLKAKRRLRQCSANWRTFLN